MIRVHRAYTWNLHDPEAAAADLLAQLNLPGPPPVRSVGLLFCYLDFLDQEVAARLCARLPFPVVGCTTLGTALPEAYDSLLLSLVVLSSDEHTFLTGVSEPLGRDAGERLRRLYRRLAGPSPAKPSLMLAFAPDLPSLSGDLITEALSGASNGAPLFGSVALDATTRNRKAQTLHNGLAWRDRLVLLLIQGPLSPSFFLHTPMDAPMDREQAVVTASDGNMVLSINHRPASVYLEEQGLIRNGAYDTLFAVPFFLTPPGGAERPNVCTNLGPRGSLVFLSRVPKNSLFRFGLLTNNLVLESMAGMAAAVRRAAAGKDHSLLLLFSCFSRNVALEDPMAEMALLREEIGPDLPFLFAYSGGEFCPRTQGAPCNDFFQHSLTGCLL
jgi:hypothetical protein